MKATILFFGGVALLIAGSYFKDRILSDAGTFCALVGGVALFVQDE